MIPCVRLYDVPVASLDWTWMDVFRVAKQSGVGIVSPVVAVGLGDGAAGGGWLRAETGSRPFPTAAFAML